MKTRWVFLAAAMILSLAPILWTVLASFEVYPDNIKTPLVWRWPARLDAFQAIQQEQTFFWDELLMNMLISILTTGLTIAVSLCAVYGLARSSWACRKMVVQGLLILACLPAISYVIPLQDITFRLRLYDTLPGVVLAEAALFAPFATYILHSFVIQSPLELEEEAILNGADLRQLLWHVVLPGIGSAILATAVIIFVLSWNQYFLPLILTNRYIHALPVMMRDFFALEREFEWPKAAAVIVISVLPALVFVAAAFRALERFSLIAFQARERQ